MKKLATLAPLVAILLLAGCATDPSTGDVQVTVPAAAVDFVTNIVQRGAAAWTDRVLRDEDTSGGVPADGVGLGAESPGPAAGAPASSTTPVESATADVALDWRYGGFRGGKASEDPRCRISKLKVGKDRLSLRWDTKIPSDWARDEGEKGALVVVAAFYKSGDRWIGGKFDWIDESRSSRSLENIHSGYGGWDSSSWSAAKKHAVCVASADGKWRSNLVED